MLLRIALLFALLIGGAALSSSPALADDSSIPDKAPCYTCTFQGSDHGPEKVVAHSEYEGTLYFFCAKGCKESFDADPLAYIPPVYPLPAAAFNATALDGADITLADYAGSWLFLDFWATWCKPCIELMPATEKMGAALADQGLKILGVSIDEDRDKPAKFVEKRKIGYPIALDDATNPSWAAYKVKVVPTAFLINPEGEIVARWVGMWDHKQVQAEVDSLISGGDSE